MTPEERAKYLETYEVSIMCFYFYLRWCKKYLHEQVLSLGIVSVKQLNKFDFTASLWSDSYDKGKSSLIF